MNIYDNTSIDEPIIGKYITLSTPLEQLAENVLYLLPSGSEDLAEKATDTFEKLSISMKDVEYVNEYSFIALDEELYTQQSEGGFY